MDSSQVSFVRPHCPARHSPASKLGRSRLSLACAILTLSALACNLPGVAGPEQAAGPGGASPAPSTLATTSPAEGTQTAESPMSSGDSTPIPGGGAVELPEEACELMPQERVEAVLGESVAETQPDAIACIHVLASGTSVTVMIRRGEEARNAFIDPIAQLIGQEGCSLSFSFSTSAETTEPTPLPAEVEALVASKSLRELGQTYVDAYAAECGEPLETVSGLGDLAFYQTLDLGFVETLTLDVVTGDAYVTFTYAAVDPEMDNEVDVLPLTEAMAWLRSLAQPVFAPPE